jgi:23S rRNA (uracil1939-C5)-methyltransferase
MVQALAHDDWTIEKLVPGGAGMARLPDGRVGFARGAWPGEVVRVTRAREHKSHREAEQLEVIRSAEERVAPPCPYANTCGGCDWMALDLGAQRENKRALLKQALERTGGFRALPEIRLFHAGPALGYRDRLRLQVSASGVLGFHAHHTREVVPIEACLVAEPKLEAALEALLALAKSHASAFTAFESLELRVTDQDDVALLRVELAPGANLGTGAVRELLELLNARFAVSVAGRREPLAQRFELPGGTSLRVPADAFVQVNWAVNRILVEAVVEGARERAIRTFCDLYGGSGNFTLPLLRAGLEGTLVEGHPGAVNAARRSAVEQELGGEFVAADVKAGLSRLLKRRRRFDLVLLDPPRSGALEIVELIAELGAPHVAYVACDPVTLARDLKKLAARGYELESASVFDMFPQTHHFESLAWLRAAPRA